MKLDHDSGGAGSRLLVLLHGLGATRDVWQPLLANAERRWAGSWIAPDLRGHGRSAHAPGYALGLHASDVAEMIRPGDDWSEIVLVGHSMGGAIALALASGWFGFAPAHAFGLGIKVAWTVEELMQLGKMAAAPTRVFETENAAVERYLKVSGLHGLVAPNSTIAVAGIEKVEQGWRLAADPATASVGAPPMRAMLAAAQAHVHLARGETDGLVTLPQFLELDAEAFDLPGLGHNAMVQDPDAVWKWIDERLA
jgi:pimeloyl-ACP methyl ester carboxylesterase